MRMLVVSMPNYEQNPYIILENGSQLSLPSTAYQMHGVTTMSQAATLLGMRLRNPTTQMKPPTASKPATRCITSINCKPNILMLDLGSPLAQPPDAFIGRAVQRPNGSTITSNTVRRPGRQEEEGGFVLIRELNRELGILGSYVRLPDRRPEIDDVTLEANDEAKAASTTHSPGP